MALAVGKDANFLSMDARLMWSNAPMPSMLNTQERLFKSVDALNMWPKHSVPARVDGAYWNGAQAFSTSCPTTLKAAGDDAPEGSACGDTSDAAVWFEERRHPGGHEGLGYAREDLCTREPQGGVMQEASSVLIVQCYFQKFRGGVSGATR